MVNKVNRVDLQRVDMQSIGRVQGRPKHEAPKSCFDEMLKDASFGIKFSKHAESRLKSRDVQLDQSQIQRMEQALEKAEAKGVRDTLLIMDNMAFIANTKSRTIITTVPKESMEENIFTNIDGAVII